LYVSFPFFGIGLLVTALVLPCKMLFPAFFISFGALSFRHRAEYFLLRFFIHIHPFFRRILKLITSGFSVTNFRITSWFCYVIRTFLSASFKNCSALWIEHHPCQKSGIAAFFLLCYPFSGWWSSDTSIYLSNCFVRS
jgi:hypothetical protein